ncbi:MAG TPA: hypothetical protein PKW94_02200 [Candidatus Dojkabacteria bacterium]|nr:hypothetical protein [Candidatus Dojkabacteria bacterium]HOR06040.1 hypothetical protein [Candidatus Dojkabacteria bacterium]HOT61086.1 hypothetical protein [Candidatus Dojkabacteria bacterium]
MSITEKDIKKISINIEMNESAKANAPVAPKATAPVAEDKIETKGDSNLFWKVLGILGLLALLALIAIMLLNKPAVSAQTPGSAPIVANPVLPNNGTLESPDPRSAGSNANFIGYFGSRGKDWVVPNQVFDTSGTTRDVGSVLFTWCDKEAICFYQILHPGDVIQIGHQGSQINIYDKAYSGQETKELQYIATKENTSWTFVQ